MLNFVTVDVMTLCSTQTRFINVNMSNCVWVMKLSENVFEGEFVGLAKPYNRCNVGLVSFLF